MQKTDGDNRDLTKIPRILLKIQGRREVKQRYVKVTIEGGNLNIGKIEGGIATNVVSPEVTVRGELRMEEHEKALETFSQTYEVSDTAGRPL